MSDFLPVPGYEGLFSVSQEGVVWNLRLDRKVSESYGKVRLRKEGVHKDFVVTSLVRRVWAETELLRPIPGYEGYFSADEEGGIFSHYLNAYLKPIIYGGKHWQVVLTVENVRTWHYVHHHHHHLILQTFVGPRPEGMQGLHKNDDRAVNRLSNLEWGTPKRNSEQAVENGRFWRKVGDAYSQE